MNNEDKILTLLEQIKENTEEIHDLIMVSILLYYNPYLIFFLQSDEASSVAPALPDVSNLSINSEKVSGYLFIIKISCFLFFKQGPKLIKNINPDDKDAIRTILTGLIDEKGFNHFYTFLDKLKKNFDEKFLTEHNKQLSDKRWQTILITFITEAIGTKDLENKIQKFKDRIPQMKI